MATPQSSNWPPDALRPLYVDLDGTLIATDLLEEALLLLARERPLELRHLPAWWRRGKAALKAEIAARVAPSPEYLPYRAEVLEFVRAEKAAGRTVVLATASVRPYADAVARHLGLFDAVLATEGERNLRGAEKLRAIQQHAGGRDFEYLANGYEDLPIWKASAACHVVGGAAGLQRRVAALGRLGRTFVPRPDRASWWRVLRPLQWAKNLLLLAPWVLAHRELDAETAISLGLALLTFSLCASGVYVGNDLFDIEADRRHERKRRRPFAAGGLALRAGLMMGVALPLIALAIAVLWLPREFVYWLVIYSVLTAGYTTYFKRKVIVDALILASLYTLRVIAGAAAIPGLFVSTWLLAFGMFFFLSLAFAKRFIELRAVADQPWTWLRGRGYQSGDFNLIRTAGVVSGYMAVLVMALYLDSPKVQALYARPELLWLNCPPLLFWITRLWLFAERGAMHDDPVVFALRDRSSYLVGAWILGITLLSA